MGMGYQFKRALRLPGRWSQQALCHTRLCHATLSVLGACCFSGSPQCPPPAGPGGSLRWAALQCKGLGLFRTHRHKDLGQTALPHPLNPTVRPFHCQALFPQHPSAGVLLHPMTVCWHVDSSFFTARLGLLTAPAVRLCAPIPPHWAACQEPTHLLWLPQPRTEGSCLAGTCRVHLFAFIFVNLGPPVLQLSARQLPTRRADHRNMRQRDKQRGLRNVLRFAKIAWWSLERQLQALAKRVTKVAPLGKYNPNFFTQ